VIRNFERANPLFESTADSRHTLRVLADPHCHSVDVIVGECSASDVSFAADLFVDWLRRWNESRAELIAEISIVRFRIPWILACAVTERIPWMLPVLCPFWRSFTMNTRVSSLGND
jgi:hypothetical protein